MSTKAKVKTAKQQKRKLTEEEIEDVLSFVKHNEAIPYETANTVVNMTKQSMRSQLETIEIYPVLIPQLQTELREMYESSLIQPGECVGIIMAQSIGEKQTQTNLNSVDWNEQILYIEQENAKVEPIGKMIDRLLENGDPQSFPESNTEYLDIKEKNMYVPSCDENGNCGWYKIEAVTRHYPKGKLVKVVTQSGRTVIATQALSFLVWDGEKFNPTNGSELKVGDILPTTSKLCRFEKTTEYFNLRSIFPPEKYLYTTEIIKAREYRSNWCEHNGKDFILPYNRRDTCFGKRKEYFMSCKPGFVYIHTSNVFVSHFLEDVKLDCDFGFFVGIYLAEGWVTKTFLGISNKDEKIRKRVMDYCDKFGFTYHTVVTEGKNCRGTSTDLKIHSTLLARMFKIICDTGSANKRVPEFSYTAPKEFLLGLLDGYFSGDGTVNKNTGNVCVSSASKTLITGISFILSYFGIFAKVSGVQPIKNNLNSKSMKYSHCLVISNGFAQLFAEKISMTKSAKQERLIHITSKKKYKYSRGKNQESFPLRDVYFDPITSIELVDGTTEYVYDFTVEGTRRFQLWNGVNQNDTFHRAGSADKQPVVSKFSELLNATNKPKAPSYFIYFKDGNTTVPELRKTIGHSIVQINFKKITKKFAINIDKQPEIWYKAFFLLHEQEEMPYKDCISIELDMDILFEYKLTLKEIADIISQEYSDLKCVYSPDCFGQIDIFVDTDTIELPEEKLIFVTQDNMREIYLEEVVQPILENIVLCGIPGIMNMFFLNEGTKETQEWFIETENSREKTVEPVRFKNIKEKPADSKKRFQRVLAHSAVDMSRTVSNNVWDIYQTLGVEATRQYMIDEFSKIMKGINTCHVMLLVDKMTHMGTLSSISRYTMRREESGPLGKSSFEETLDNFLAAGAYGQDEPTRGVSAAIICGKMAAIGTGMCELEMDLNKMMSIPEGEGEGVTEYDVE